MATVLAKVERPCGIKQLITATNNFDGSAPTGTPTFADDIFKFATATAGGLFDPTSSKYAFEPHEALYVASIYIKFGGQSAWTLDIVDVDGVIFPLASGTTETEYVRGTDDPIVVLWGSKIKLTTTGATTAMNATVIFAPHQLYT